MEKITLNSYEHDSPELISKIGYLLGSDEWYNEHSQHLWRKKGKVFYLLDDDSGKLLTMCSIYKNQICDVYTVPEYRKQGYFRKLINMIVKPNMTIGTANPFVKRVVTSIGFKHKGYRGKYEYFKN